MATSDSRKPGPASSDATQALPSSDATDATQAFSPSDDSSQQGTLQFELNSAAPASPVDSTQEFKPGAQLDMYAVHEGIGHAPEGGAGGAPAAGRRYRILREHAKGGLGQVFLAHDEDLCREVALKEIRIDRPSNRESQARFVMEAQVTGALQHPGIVPVYGLGAYSDGRPFYAMRFVEGDDLEVVVASFHKRRGELAPGEATLELRQLINSLIAVCHAIEYAHARGILHRDIKPKNIMLGKYGETLVVDWGIAKVMNQPAEDSSVNEGSVRLNAVYDTEATTEGTAKGTLQYVSPEQAHGKVSQLGPASDIYSLGATLYFILTGRGRFEGNMRFSDFLVKLKAGDFPSPRQIDRSIARPLEAICLKAMATERTERYLSARALASDLEHWLADEPVTAYRESRWERSRRWLRHHRIWAQASLAILVSVTLVSVVAAVLINEARQRENLARQAAEREHARAEENFRHARQAVDTFFTQISESTLLNVPGMQPLRRELLQTALDYEQQFLKQRGDDPALKREVAAAAFRAALATAAIKSGEAALPLYDRARKIQEALLQVAPHDSELRYALSNTYNEIGREHHDAARYEQSLDWFRKSLDERLELVNRHNDNLEYRRKLASTKNNLAVIAKEMGQYDQAHELYTQALEILKKLFEHDNRHALYRRDLARTHYNLGNLSHQQGQWATAADNLNRAAEKFKNLADEFPLITEYGQKAGICYQLLGDQQLRADEFQAAVASFEQARAIQEPLSWRNPELVDLAVDLAATYSHLARWCEYRDDLGAAFAWVAEVDKVLRPLTASHPENVRCHTYLAANLVRTGTLQMAFDNDSAALPALEEALAMYQALEPHMQGAQAEIAKCLMNIGLVQGRQGNWQLARNSLLKARARYEALLAGAAPNDSQQPSLQDGLALCYTNLGLVEQADEDLDAALKNFSQARKIHEQYLDDAAAGGMHRIHLVETLFLIGTVQAQQQQADAALETCKSAGTIIQTAIDQASQRPQPLRLSAEAAHRRGAIFLAQQLDQKSLEAYREAVDQQTRAFELSGQAALYRQTLDTYLGDLALVQNSSGLTPEAVATTLRRKDLWPNDVQRLYKIAADLASIALRDPAQLSDNEKMDQLRYIDSVIALLNDARRAGFTDWETAEKDPAFLRLSDEPRFQQLIAGGR